MVAALVERGTRVLTETPPAPDADGLRQLWAAVGGAGPGPGRRAVPAAPGTRGAACAVVARGAIGTPTSVQVSSTHGYHAVSMMRGFLGAGDSRRRSPVTVSARRSPRRWSTRCAGTAGPTTTSRSRRRPPWRPSTSATAGPGLYDFTDNQWHNQLRFRRILIRGSARRDLGRQGGPAGRAATPSCRVDLARYQLGHDLNLDGHDTEHISFDGRVVYRNPFLGQRLMDEEIAIASMMAATAAWARDEGPAPYPLADGCQDHLISLAIDESAASGQPWSRPSSPGRR